MGPGRWLNWLSRDQATNAAIQLHRDVCLMTTNLNVLDQYALSLQGTASKMLQLGLSSIDFPSADVAAGALGPRVRRAWVQMEAMGLRRPSLNPIILLRTLDSVRRNISWTMFSQFERFFDCVYCFQQLFGIFGFCY